jgi:hypothetical protein
MALILLGHLPRTSGHGIYGSCGSSVFWPSGHKVTVVIDRYGDGAILRWMALCSAREPRGCQSLAVRGVRKMRVERERELRRRRKRHEKARKARRKAALMQAGKWPLPPIKT